MQIHKQEQKCIKQNGLVIGVDEAGRGPLAGPVVAAAVVLSKRKLRMKFWREVNDSKRLTDKKRRELTVFIHQHADDVGVGMATHEEIDQLNILNASLLAMQRAVESLKRSDLTVFVDGRFKIPDLNLEQVPMIHADSKILSVAAASIVAKVMRDDLMKQYAKQYPEFHFDEHKGYATTFHRKALAIHGPCEIHRLSFETVKQSVRE